ncbi:MAG: galactosyldiacylglycerol synthase, partial [Chloroflexi bacterium]
MKKRILFLISDTGGGHRASARAIDEAIQHLYPDQFDTIIEDIFEHTPWPFRTMPEAYSWLIGPGLPLWKSIWLAARFPRMSVKFVTSTYPLLKQGMTSYLRRIQPDLIVSVHPLTNHLGVRMAKAAALGHVPFITVVTDMVSIHPTWICPDVTACIVPTDLAYDQAIAHGISPKKVTVHGQPVSLKFTDIESDKIKLRQKLNLDVERDTVLIVGGGEGFGQVFETARSIAQTVPTAQLLVVAGRNETLKTELDVVTWEIPTHIYGFVDNMPELMAASDVLVTKAGPGTICEAFIAGLPPLLSWYIPGQEAGNVTYVTHNNAGAFVESPLSIAQTVQTWLSQNETLRELTEN